MLLDILEICKIEDAESQIEELFQAKNTTFLGNFVKPTDKQTKILRDIRKLSAASNERLRYILRLGLQSIQNSIYRVHATILEFQFTDDQLRSSVNNVFSERVFGQLDNISRLHRNLKFVHRETIVMASTNKFWDWFELWSKKKLLTFYNSNNFNKSYLTIEQDLTDTDQDDLMDKSRRLVRNLASQYRDADLLEERLRQELQQQKLADNFAEKQKILAKKNKLLADLSGCEVYWAANYSSCLYDFTRAQPTLDEIDFLKFNLALKKIELKSENRPASDFAFSHKGKIFTVQELRNKLLNLLH